jgi:NADH-quinone oxidoreductase subunit J
MSLAAFIPLAILAILSALGVVLNRHPVRSALCLVATLFVIAIIFVFLDAYMVAALQVLVYAGAIMVLFMFVIMLLNLTEEPVEQTQKALRAVVLAVGAALVLLIGIAMSGSGSSAGPPAAEFGSTAALSERLFTHFLLPFEITSLLLLIAIVGAVVIAKRKLD